MNRKKLKLVVSAMSILLAVQSPGAVLADTGQETAVEAQVSTEETVSEPGTEEILNGMGTEITQESEGYQEEILPGTADEVLPGTGEEESYEDYELVFEQKETCTVPTPVTETGLIDMEHRSEFLKDTDTLPLKHDLFSVDAVILDQLKSRAVTLKSKKHNKGIRIDFNQFPYLILWSTAKEADFVALEPWIGLSTCSDEGDKFEEKRNIQYAQAGEVKEYEFHINIL